MTDSATKAGDLLTITQHLILWRNRAATSRKWDRGEEVDLLGRLLEKLEAAALRITPRPAEPALAAPADAIGLLHRCSSWLALMNSGKEGDGHVFDKLRRDLHAFLFQRPNPTPSASDTEPASARRLIAKYDDAFALASRPQPARGDCSTSMLALLREIRDELVGDVDYCSETGGNKAARLVAAIDMEIHRATGEITA